MKLDFDFKQIAVTEFGVGREDANARIFALVPADKNVQSALHEMAENTRDKMLELTNDPPRYQPSEKHGSTEYVYLPLADDLAQQIRQLHQAENLPTDTGALADPAKLFCYFSRMTDKQGRRLTALRRATQFKGVVKKRLITLMTDALTLIGDRVFKLDTDFDLLSDNRNVHILRPKGFEFVGKLQDAVLAAVPENVKALKSTLKFVDFSLIQAYATQHPRAARYLASIRALNGTRGVDKRALKKLCKDTGVELQEVKGTITVHEAHVMGFLEVLDRRRYEVELVKNSPERFKAGSRQRIEANG